jgi:hypothetical protein
MEAQVTRALASTLGLLLAAGVMTTQVSQGQTAQAPQSQTAQPAGAAQAPAPGRGGAPGRGRGPAPQPRIVTFEARPATIKPGESALLVWHVENPSAVAIEPGIGRVIPRGTQRVTPAATTTYTLSVGDNAQTVTVTVPGTTPVTASSASAAAPVATGIARTSDGKPDFSGVYAFGGGGRGGARGGGARGGAQAGPVLKPGAEQYRVNRAADPLDTGRTADCMPLIPPDAFGVPYQFQIIQNQDYLVIFHEYPGSFRIIPLDGEPHPVEPDPAWLGDSVGRWDGDTLIIDTIGYNDKTEISGFRHTDALHTIERLTRTDAGFDYEITVEDPNVFVAPWTVTRSFRFNDPPMKRIMEFVCENNRDYRPLFGAQGAQGSQGSQDGR